MGDPAYLRVTGACRLFERVRTAPRQLAPDAGNAVKWASGVRTTLDVRAAARSVFMVPAHGPGDIAGRQNAADRVSLMGNRRSLLQARRTRPGEHPKSKERGP